MGALLGSRRPPPSSRAVAVFLPPIVVTLLQRPIVPPGPRQCSALPPFLVAASISSHEWMQVRDIQTGDGGAGAGRGRKKGSRVHLRGEQGAGDARYLPSPALPPSGAESFAVVELCVRGPISPPHVDPRLYYHCRRPQCASAAHVSTMEISKILPPTTSSRRIFLTSARGRLREKRLEIDIGAYR